MGSSKLFNSIHGVYGVYGKKIHKVSFSICDRKVGIQSYVEILLHL